MEIRISRRRFGQLAIATTTIAGFSYLASKTSAQTSGLTIAGISSRGTVITPDSSRTDVSSPSVETGDASDTSDTSQQVIISSIDLPTGRSQRGVTSALPTDESISGFAYLIDGTPVVAITPARTSRRKGRNPTRLSFPGISRAEVTVSGLTPQQRLESLMVTPDGTLFGLVANKNGTPPVRLVEVNPNTGTFNVRLSLPSDQKYSTLAICPNGTIYTTAVANGATTLVRINLAQASVTPLVQLRLNNNSWGNGLQSLLCNNANQLIAFGAPRYIQPNALYTVDLSSGAMAKLVDFDAARVAMRTT
ncbi:hypothetical protein IQ272_15455 [Chroococcidiopsidales cyanobacterium LEGE 13417]|nr:hypothetical protein [Chroococcidiopsidales cyanobacterium LEGE 13417]